MGGDSGIGTRGEETVSDRRWSQAYIENYREMSRAVQSLTAREAGRNEQRVTGSRTKRSIKKKETNSMQTGLEGSRWSRSGWKVEGGGERTHREH
jgi:hypothetical protein